MKGLDLLIGSNRKCLICNGKVSPEYQPFCSMRCKDLDLGKWLNESYRIETQEKLRVIGSDRIETDEGDEF